MGQHMHLLRLLHLLQGEVVGEVEQHLHLLQAEGGGEVEQHLMRLEDELGLHEGKGEGEDAEGEDLEIL